MAARHPPNRPRTDTIARKARPRRRRLWWYVAAAFAGPLLLIGIVLTYSYITLSRVIEARLHGEQARALPRIFARPLELRVGQSLTDRQLIDRLNDLGYAHQPRVEPARRVRDRAERRGPRRPRGAVRPCGGPGGLRPGLGPAWLASHCLDQAPGAERPAEAGSHARTASHHRAGVRRARETAQGAAGADSGSRPSGGAGDRRSPLLRSPGRGSDPIGRRHRHQRPGRQALSRRRQHAHPAAREEPDADAREVHDPQAQRAVHGGRGRHSVSARTRSSSCT